jgi:hypothetical protein
VIYSDDWYFDTPLIDVLNDPHKRYIVFFESVEDYGIYFGTDNIIEFINGVASCPTVLATLSSRIQDWRTLKYLDTTKDIGDPAREHACFNLCVADLHIVPDTIVINMRPF